MIKKSGKGITPHTVATGAAVPAELSVIDAYSQGHPETKGYFAVDAGSTQSIAQTMQKHDLRSKGVKARRLRPHADHAEAAGRRPTGLHDRPAAVPAGLHPDPAAVHVPGVRHAERDRRRNTGLKFLDKTTVTPYNDTKSRYEGTSDKAGVAKA